MVWAAIAIAVAVVLWDATEGSRIDRRLEKERRKGQCMKHSSKK